MLFKYTKNENFYFLIRNGSVKIGTLHGYQNCENGIMVNDDMEGKKRFNDSFTRLNAEQIRTSSTLMGMLGYPSDQSLIENVSFHDIQVSDPNCFIFSMSETYSRDQHLAFRDEEGYDICYHIDSLDFFELITSELNKICPVDYKGVFRVNYYDESAGLKFFDREESWPAAIIKNKGQYGNQTEARAIWVPQSNQAIRPQIILNKELQRCVSLVADTSSYK